MPEGFHWVVDCQRMHLVIQAWIKADVQVGKFLHAHLPGFLLHHEARCLFRLMGGFMESRHSEWPFEWRSASGSDSLVLTDSWHIHILFRRVGMVRTNPKTKLQSPLLATAINEPFQPVRLYFAVPDADALLQPRWEFKRAEVEHLLAA